MNGRWGGGGGEILNAVGKFEYRPSRARRANQTKIDHAMASNFVGIVVAKLQIQALQESRRCQEECYDDEP